jgi:nucleoside-diphosphate-sugar epimerase
MSDDKVEHERQPSEIKIFVDICDGYIGSAVIEDLVKLGYDVYGYGTTTNPKVK